MEVHNFIKDCHNDWLSRREFSVHFSESDFSFSQIPTAFLLAAVNTPDHSKIYDLIKLCILKNNGHVAIINPEVNTNSLRSLMNLVVDQLKNGSNKVSKLYNGEECLNENTEATDFFFNVRFHVYIYCFYIA